MMSFDFLHGKSAAKFSRYVLVGKVTMEHLRLLDFLKELSKGFTRSQCWLVTGLDDLIFKEYDDQTVLFSILMLLSGKKMICSTHVPSISLLICY